MKFGFDWSRGFKRRCLQIMGHKLVYSPEVGADNPGIKVFKSSVFWSFLVFSCRRKGQGLPKVIIYTSFVELQSSMLHAKFQIHQTSSSAVKIFKVFIIYGHGRHLDHVTWTIYIFFCSPFRWMLHIKFAFDWPSGFRDL